MSANDELQAHTCEKILQECGDVANNVAQSKVQDLTEQWKKGELEWHKSYYCQNRKGEVTKAICLGDSELHSEELGGTLNIGYWEVLVPVPSYEEWKELKDEVEIYHNNFKLMKAELERELENQQLKELLKECRDLIGKIEFCTPNCYKTLEENILTKIDNAIGDKK